MDEEAGRPPGIGRGTQGKYFPLRLQVKGEETEFHGMMSELLPNFVKLFLFQRNQIPVPYEALHLNLSTDVNGEDTGPFQNFKGDSKVTGPAGETTGSQKVETEESRPTNYLDVQRRINALKREYREAAKRKRLEVKCRKQLEAEASVRNIWDPAITILKNVFNDITGPYNFPKSGCMESEGKNHLSALVLIFGPSAHCPRETLILEFPSTDLMVLLSQSPNQFSKNSSSRHIFREIIMSQEFMEFTSKPLPKTFSHLLIVSSKPDLKVPHLIPVEQGFTLQGPGSRSNVFHIKLEPIETVLPSNIPFTKLFENPDLRAYQVLSRFRGISQRLI